MFEGVVVIAIVVYVEEMNLAESASKLNSCDVWVGDWYLLPVIC